MIISKIIEDYYFDHGPTKYRFFSQESYARDFINGRIRISTLKSCRYLENAKARDETEGGFNPFSGNLFIDSTSNPDNQQLLRELQILGITGQGTNIRIHHSDYGQRKLDDAFVLCLSNKQSPYLRKNFGRYAVKMIFTEYIGSLIAKELTKKLQRNVVLLDKEITYDDKQSITLSSSSLVAEMGFLKRKVFAPEDKYRLMVPVSRNEQIEPIFVDVGNISNLCRYIDY